MNKQIIIHYVFVSLICALISFFGFRKIHEVKSSQKWPSVTGVVIKSSVNKSTSSQNGRHRSVYIPTIEYKYAINGTTYKNNKVSLSTKHIGEGTAKSIVKKYPIGLNAEIYYNPKQPGRSILVKTDDISGALLYTGPAIFWILYMLFRKNIIKNTQTAV